MQAFHAQYVAACRAKVSIVGAVSRAQEAAWEQQRRAGVARDEAMLKQERRALGEANRAANEAAGAEEKVIA